MNVESYKGGLYDKESDISRKIQELEDEIIIYTHGPEGEIKNNEKVTKIYFEFIESKKGMPSLSDILDVAYEHNERMYNEIGKLSIILEPDNLEEVVDSIAEYYNYYSTYYDLGAYIEEILLGNNLCFYYDGDSDIYYNYIDDPDIIVVANDCQNTLMDKLESEDEFLWGGDSYEENIKKFRLTYVGSDEIE